MAPKQNLVLNKEQRAKEYQTMGCYSLHNNWKREGETERQREHEDDTAHY